MANKKITDLVDIGTPASGDLLEIVDISEGVSKRVAVSALGGSTPTLQEVTDAGNTILDNDIIFNNTGNDFETTINEFSDGGIYLRSVVNDTLTTIGAGVIYLGDIDGSDSVVITKDAILVDSVSYLFPVGASSPLATLDDIPAAITIDATPTDGSANAVSSNGVFDALATKFQLPALTSGSVLFSNGSTIAQDNANFFWDDTNNRLGIGTNAPNQSLDLLKEGSGAYFQSRTYRSSEFGGGFIFLHARGTVASPTFLLTNDRVASIFFKGYDGTVGNDANSASIESFATANHSALNTQGRLSFSVTNTGIAVTELMRLSNGNVIIQNGGTFTDAGFRLDVNGTTRLNGNTSIGGSTAGARLDVRAQGALSTDIAFRVRNSANSANLVDVNGAGGVSINSTTQGFLPPRMTNAQRLAIASPAVGLIVYCTDATEGLYVNKSGGWTFII